MAEEGNKEHETADQAMIAKVEVRLQYEYSTFQPRLVLQGWYVEATTAKDTPPKKAAASLKPRRLEEDLEDGSAAAARKVHVFY